MTFAKELGTALFLTTLCFLAAPKAKADEWNQKTTVTFTEPVEVPGVGQHLLPPGTYVFKLMDSLTNRHIVQIFSQDETHVFTTILAIPNHRSQATDKPIMTFRETPAGQPQSLKAWFYSGRKSGYAFVYEKPRAMELAKANKEPVLATPVALADAPIEALKSAPVEAVSPEGEDVDVAQVDQKPAPELVASLPQTASGLPFIGLIGLLLLCAGFGLRGILKLNA